MEIKIKICGGIGDALICSSVSSRKKAVVYCRDHQVEILNNLENVEAHPIPRNGFVPGSVDMDMLFCGVRGLRNEDYYSLLEERVGFSVSPARFKFKPEDKDKVVYIHPTPSDKNREWDNDYWKELAYQLRDCGNLVYFLGTEIDYGFSDRGIEKLSDYTNNLVWQAKQLGGMFIGVDSGFCHIAGILGVKGYVIFTNTLPKNVICRYASLEGICPDDFHPSMICGLYCEKSRKYAKSITPQKVMEIVGAGKPTFQERNPLEKTVEIGIIYNRENEDFASRIYSHFPDKKFVNEPRPITLEILDRRSILIRTPNSSGIFISSLSNLHRAINELIGSSPNHLGLDLCQPVA